jgi:hypothetical protein
MLMRNSTRCGRVPGGGMLVPTYKESYWDALFREERKKLIAGRQVNAYIRKLMLLYPHLMPIQKT